MSTNKPKSFSIHNTDPSTGRARNKSSKINYEALGRNKVNNDPEDRPAKPRKSNKVISRLRRDSIVKPTTER